MKCFYSIVDLIRKASRCITLENVLRIKKLRFHSHLQQYLSC